MVASTLRRTIITILFALVAMAGQAKTFKTIKNPETMACVNVNPGIMGSVLRKRSGIAKRF